MTHLARTLCIVALACSATCTRSPRRPTTASTHSDATLLLRDAALADVIVRDERGDVAPEVPATLARAVDAVRRDDAAFRRALNEMLVAEAAKITGRRIRLTE